MHWNCPLLIRHSEGHILNTTDTWSILVLPEIDQQLTEALLARSARSAPRTFAGNIDQLRNAFPASTTGGCVLAVSKELLRICPGLTTEFVGLVVIRDVEVIDIFARLLDCGFFFLVRNLSTSGYLCVSLCAPFPVFGENRSVDDCQVDKE